MELFNIFSGGKLYYKYPNGDEVYNVVTAYICEEFSGELIKENHEVKEVKFFPLTKTPKNISPPDKPVIEAFIKKC